MQEELNVSEGEILWRPSDELSGKSRMLQYMKWLRSRGVSCNNYNELWQWSVNDLERFWESLLHFFNVKSSGSYSSVIQSRAMPASGWFRGLSVNYAENILEQNRDGDAIIYISEEKGEHISWEELRRQVHALASYLKEKGVSSGDRVACYSTNSPVALITLLASASIGAIFSSCSPEMGARSVLDRFAQIEPKVLVATTSYTYGGKRFDRGEVVKGILSSLPSVSLFIEQGNEDGRWRDAISGRDRVDYERVPFEHPLWILYSSGTTGLPKAIVHGQGGILLEHLKLLSLHHDMGEGRKFFWYTTTGWMMWNVVVSSLLCGATAILYDGSAMYPDAMALWEMAEREGMDTFGTSASFINACMKAGIEPGTSLNLKRLRSVAYTGSPLQPSGFAWLFRKVKEDLWVQGVSGGTDVCTAFLCGCPLLPVKAGMMQCRALGADVQSYSEEGRPLLNQVGELVLTKHMPSMPLYFWNDKDGSRYRESYFSYFPGVWRHGDWVKIDVDGSAAIYGRSDATLKRQGVRMGTSEIYGCVEEIPWVKDALIVGLEREGDYYMPLFVSLKEGMKLDEAKKEEIRNKIRRELSPRHVPDNIIQVDGIPRTLNGKKLEVPVKRILSGIPPEKAVNMDSVANPEALEFFIRMSRK